MTSGSQLPLPRFQAPRCKGPVCAMETAKDLLEATEDEVIALVDDGSLYAWNIAKPGAERRELRILTASIAQYLKENPDRSDCWKNMMCPDVAILTVLAAIKHQKPFVTGKEVKRLLNCGRQHLINLVEAGALQQMPGTRYRPGPNGSPVISRDAFVAFLKSRMEGGVFDDTLPARSAPGRPDTANPTEV